MPLQFEPSMLNDCQLSSGEDKVYFEAVCLLDTNAIPTTTSKDRNQSVAFGKISRFCRESGLHAYVIKFMVHPSVFLASVRASLKTGESDDQYSDDHHRTSISTGKPTKPDSLQHVVFLTKQKLIPTTGYYCKTNNLSARLFANAQVLLGNSVKRILAKSDSKFVEKFALLLEIGVVYVCKRRYQDMPQAADEPRKTQKTTQGDIYYRFTSPAAGKLSLSIYSQATLPNSLSFMLSMPNQQTPSFKCNPTSIPKLAETALSLPNLLICLPTDPPTVQAYVLAKITEGNQEEGVCPLGTISSQSGVQPPTLSAEVSGLGPVHYTPLLPEEPTTDLAAVAKQEYLPTTQTPKPKEAEQAPPKDKLLSTSNYSTKAFSSKMALSTTDNKENVVPNTNKAIVGRQDPEFPSLQVVQTATRRYSENDKREITVAKNSLVLGSEAFYIPRDTDLDEMSGDEMPLPKPNSRSKESERKPPSLSVERHKEGPEHAEVVADSVLQAVGLLYSQEKNPQSQVKASQRRQRVDAMMEKWRLGAFRNRRYTLF